MSKISILISTYNSDCHIHRAIDNLKRISDSVNIEIIWVANEVSKIEELALIEAKHIFGSSLKLIIVKRESLYASWNKAIASSSSSILTIYNIDDYRFVDNFVIQANKHYINSDINILYSSFVINKNFSYIKQQESVEGKNNNNFTNSMIIGPYFSFSKKELMYSNYFDEQLRVAGDFDFQIRRSYEGKFEKLNQNAGIYLDNSKGLSTSGFSQLIEEQVVNLRYNIKDKIYPFFKFFVKFTSYDPFHLYIENEKKQVSLVCKDYEKICMQNNKISKKKNFNQRLFFYFNAFKFYIRLFFHLITT